LAAFLSHNSFKKSITFKGEIEGCYYHPFKKY